MGADAIVLPEGVRDLLGTIDSFEKLEIIRALAAGGGEPQPLTRLASSLGLSEEAIEPHVQELVAAGLVARGSGGSVRAVPGSPERDQAVATLCRLYQDDKLLIVRAITALAMARIRSSAARTFSDAFMLRRKPKEPS